MESVQMLHLLLAKFLTMNIHSMCVLNGFAIGGGLFMALNHDRLIMTSNPNFKVSLPEVKMKVVIPHAWIQNVTHVTNGQTSRILCSGKALNGVECKKLGFVHDLYEDTGSLELQIQNFAKEYQLDRA